MGVWNGMFPIKEGKEEDGRAFAAEVLGAQRAGFEARHARTGTSRETWTLVRTPVGSFVVVWFEGDPEKAFADLATDDSEHTKWFRDQVLNLSGVDLAVPADGPAPEVLLDWSA